MSKITAAWESVLAILKSTPPHESHASTGLVEIGATTLKNNDGQVIGRALTRQHAHKITPLAGAEAKLWKVDLHWNGQCWQWSKEELPFGADELTACWAEPYSRSLYCLQAPDAIGPDYKKNFEELGFSVNWTPKTYKRLKRIFSVDCLKSTSKFTWEVIPDSEAPVSLTDGFCWGRLDFFRGQLGDESLMDGDMFQVSMLTPQGLFKGNCVLRETLKHDVVIPGSHNMKQEVRHVEQFFFIESRLSSGRITTDLQTMINTGAISELKRAWASQMEYLTRLAIDPETRTEWWAEFERHDWWERAQKELDGKQPEREEDVEPILTAAHMLGIDPSMSPRLIAGCFKYEARRMNLRRLKIPVRKTEDGGLNGVRGYITPDLSQFDEQGRFKPAPDLALPPSCVAFPAGKLPPGDCLMYRQPNGPGEQVVCLSSPASRKSRVAVQLSICSIDPSLASLYPSNWKTPAESSMTVMGGADYDDSVCGLVDEETVRAARRMARNMARHKVPRVNLEAVIDRSKQVASNWTLAGQFALSTGKPLLGLAPTANFLMGAMLRRDWETVRAIAMADTELKLAWVHTRFYWGDEGGALVPDLWQPTSQDVRERSGRVPIASWDPFQYVPTRAVPTRLGRMVADMTEKTAIAHASITADAGRSYAWINSHDGLLFLRGLVTNPMAWPVGTMMAGLWTRLCGWGRMLAPDIEALLPDFETCKKLSWSTREQAWSAIAWNHLSLKEFQHDDLVQVVAACALAMWKHPTSAGREGPLWEVARNMDEDWSVVRNEDGTFNRGIRGAWLTILFQGQKERFEVS